MNAAPSLESGDSSTLMNDTKPSVNALLDWDGPGDPGNPRNWTLATKIYATAVPAMYAFAVYVSFL